MYGLLLGLLILDGIFLSVVILLQAGKGGGLAAMGGGAAATDVLGGRQATTLLTRATWTGGTLFMVLALVLSIMSSQATVPTSILEGVTAPSTSAPQPVLPGAEPVTPPPAGATEDPGGAAEGEGNPPGTSNP
jgi:preprotein translocase subunit SecG